MLFLVIDNIWVKLFFTLNSKIPGQVEAHLMGLVFLAKFSLVKEGGCRVVAAVGSPRDGKLAHSEVLRAFEGFDGKGSGRSHEKGVDFSGAVALDIDVAGHLFEDEVGAVK